MKDVSEIQRKLNIIQKAVDSWFEINETDTFEDVVIACEDYLIGDDDSPIEEECEVESGSQQWFCYNDRMGYEINVTGEIYNFEQTRLLSKGDKVFYQKVVNSQGVVVSLYHVLKS